jgi:hypothetical protein
LKKVDFWRYRSYHHLIHILRKIGEIRWIGSGTRIGWGSQLPLCLNARDNLFDGRSCLSSPFWSDISYYRQIGLIDFENTDVWQMQNHWWIKHWTESQSIQWWSWKCFWFNSCQSRIDSKKMDRSFIYLVSSITDIDPDNIQLAHGRQIDDAELCSHSFDEQRHEMSWFGSLPTRKKKKKWKVSRSSFHSIELHEMFSLRSSAPIQFVAVDEAEQSVTIGFNG